MSTVDKPDHLIIEWNGNCAYGHPYCPGIRVKHKGEWIVVDKAKGTLDVPAQGFSIARDWFAVLKLLAMQKDLPRDYYTINSYLCQGHAAADAGADQWLQVQVFPQAEWTADFSIGYSHKHVEEIGKDGKKKEKPFDYEPESTWIVGGSATAQLGWDKFNYSLTSGVKADALPLFGSLLSKIGKLSTIFESMAKTGFVTKLEPKFPNWKMGGSLKLVELPDKLTVGSEGGFKFRFDPLFGMELEVSILDWLIKFAGGVAGPPGVAFALFLTKLRKRLAEGKGDKTTKVQAKLDIDIAIKVEGEIKGGFGMKYVDGKGDIDPEAAQIEAAMGISINGHIIGTGRAWRVEASAAVQVGSAGADGREPSKFGGRLKPKSPKEPLTIAGQLFFTGLALYYLGYVEFGIKTEETSPLEHEDDPENTRKKGWGKKYESRGTCVLLEEWTWPKGAE